MAKAVIAIEGSDGAGKETQTRKLKAFFEGKRLTVGTEPFPRYKRTTGGWVLWEALKGDDSAKYNFAKLDPYAASLPYMMDRRESRGFIQELIDSHDVALFDRYVESNLLHQGGKIPTTEERVRYGEWLYAQEYGVMGVPRPDFVIYLQIPFWLSRARAERRAAAGGPKLDAVESDIDYVRMGHEGGVFYAKHFGWVVVDGLEGDHKLTEDEVHQKLIQQIRPRLAAKGLEI